MKVMLKHTQSGMVKDVKVGFSWTTLFFGFWPAIFRGDIKWAIIQFIVDLITLGVAALVWPFIYNKIYIKGLLEKGYAPADETAKSALVTKGIPVL